MVVLNVRVEVPVEPGVRLMLVGLNAVVMPVPAGETVADRATLPVNPKLDAVIVDVAEPPAVILEGVAAPAVSVKSAVTVTVTVAV